MHRRARASRYVFNAHCIQSVRIRNDPFSYRSGVSVRQKRINFARDLPRRKKPYFAVQTAATEFSEWCCPKIVRRGAVREEIMDHTLKPRP